MILIIMALACTISLAVAFIFKKWSTQRKVFIVISGVAGILLFIVLICWPIAYYGDTARILEFKAIQKMYNIIGKNSPYNIDRAGIVKKAIDLNGWIVKTKYWNGTIFDIFVPDEIMNLKEIK